MEIYKKPSVRNLLLLIVGAFILIVTVVYANYLARQLSDREDKIQELYNDAQAYVLQNQDLEADFTIADKVREKYNLPIISEYEGVLSGNNWGESRDTNQVFLRLKVEEFIKSNREPLVGTKITEGYTFYTFKSSLSTYIRFFPAVQFLLLGFFIAFGYYLINAARRGEQNRVWAGMAKETAHQLGTPISAIIAWIEFLKESNAERPDQLEVIGELRSDVNRLELIADRFSKIGASPELERANVYKLLGDIETYMKRRSPRKVTFDFPEGENQKDVMVNQHLFSWVLENLIRNSLDALDGKGNISAKVSESDKHIIINVSDTGKGIPSSKHKEIFKPGFSTKKRGWGLGLSLAKRIIEEYHKGKIFVKSSRPNEGTTFTIQLPRT